MFCFSRLCHFKFFEGCLPQISLGPFLNILSHMSLIGLFTTACCYGAKKCILQNKNLLLKIKKANASNVSKQLGKITTAKN